MKCTGGTTETRDKLLGALKGIECQARARFFMSLVSSQATANWLRQRFNGLVSFYAPFIRPTIKLSNLLQTVQNGFCRVVGNFHRRWFRHEPLQLVRHSFDLDLERLSYRSFVKRLAHVSRHKHFHFCACINFPFGKMLESQRTPAGQSQQSRAGDNLRKHLSSLGIPSPLTTAGALASRLGSGSLVSFWASPWFEAIRDA